MTFKRTSISVFAILSVTCLTPVAQAQEETSETDGEIETVKIGGTLKQGGFIRGQLPEGARLTVDEKTVPTSSTGHFIVGLDRDAKEELTIQFGTSETQQDLTLAIAPRTYREGQVIQGLTRIAGPPAPDPLGPDDLFPSDEELEAEIADQPQLIKSGSLPRPSLTRAQQSQKKAEALNSRADIDGFMQDWLHPFSEPYPISSPWGAARIVKGNPRIHYGVDIAAPLGTEIMAPASGIVTLAATDYYYEGGVVFIDHGLGLTSIYLHMSEVDVSEGDVITQGDILGKVGAEGRASGPHLCWRLYWNGRAVKLDPQGF